MDIGKLFETELIKILGIIIGALFLSAWALFKKLPKTIIIRINEKKHIEVVKRGSTINNILSVLAEYSGAIYIHIIRYHNGKNKPFIVPNKMSVMWEEIGHACPTCISRCKQYNKVERIQQKWQSIEISERWAAVPKNTEKFASKINKVNHEDMSYVDQAIWENLGVQSYKEIFIKRRRNGIYTLGLSFCGRFKDYDQSNGMMSLAARQLKNLI